MEDVRGYILTVIAAAMICGILNTIMDKKGTMTAAVKMLTGLFMAVAVLSPWIHLRVNDFQDLTTYWEASASDAAAQGEKMAQEATAAIIKQQTEAYILDKAASLELDIDVEVRLGSDNPLIPEKVIIRGSASPYGKGRLCQWIAEDLGIPEENQIWT